MRLEDFESDAHGALLDEAEAKARTEIAPDMESISTGYWQSYAQLQGYDIQHIWQGAEGPNVTRDESSISIEYEYPPLTNLFEWGVEPHVIEGNPYLAFHWDAPPEGTRPSGAPAYIVAESVNWGSVTGGISESRAIRDMMNEIRRSLEN